MGTHAYRPLHGQIDPHTVWSMHYQSMKMNEAMLATALSLVNRDDDHQQHWKAILFGGLSWKKDNGHDG